MPVCREAVGVQPASVFMGRKWAFVKPAHIYFGGRLNIHYVPTSRSLFLDTGQSDCSVQTLSHACHFLSPSVQVSTTCPKNFPLFMEIGRHLMMQVMRFHLHTDNTQEGSFNHSRRLYLLSP